MSHTKLLNHKVARAKASQVIVNCKAGHLSVHRLVVLLQCQAVATLVPFLHCCGQHRKQSGISLYFRIQFVSHVTVCLHDVYKMDAHKADTLFPFAYPRALIADPLLEFF
jgi:hypothetical protein